jgi:hypothetical protein
MPALLAVVIPLLIQYGPAAVLEIEQLIVEIKALYFDGHVPTEAEFALLDVKLKRSHERLQATK